MFSAIILAAGSASRMEGINKQLAEISGVPVFIMSALNFQRSDKVEEIIIAAPSEYVEQYAEIADNSGITKLKAVVCGGSSRALSVKNALSQVSQHISHIAVHDGARPLITTLEIDKVLCDAEKHSAAIAAIKAVDTVKKVSAEGFVTDTPKRSELYYAETPQAFSKGLYLQCLEQLGDRIDEVTDDSSIFEMCGKSVKITEIACNNMKITRPEDLSAAIAIYENRGKQS